MTEFDSLERSLGTSIFYSILTASFLPQSITEGIKERTPEKATCFRRMSRGYLHWFDDYPEDTVQTRQRLDQVGRQAPRFERFANRAISDTGLITASDGAEAVHRTRATQWPAGRMTTVQARAERPAQ